MNINNQQRTDIQMDIINTFRYFWRQHFSLLTEFENNIICDIGDLSTIKNSMNENIHNFTNELQKYYGFNRTKTFESLINDYINDLTDFFTDIKTGDTKSADVNRIKWHQSADSLAEYLSNINTYWDARKWKNIFYNHLNLIEKDANLRSSTKCTTGLGYQGEVESDLLNTADYLTNGIIQQFNI